MCSSETSVYFHHTTLWYIPEKISLSLPVVDILHSAIQVVHLLHRPPLHYPEMDYVVQYSVTHGLLVTQSLKKIISYTALFSLSYSELFISEIVFYSDRIFYKFTRKEKKSTSC
jgi:hypothetical protein